MGNQREIQQVYPRRGLGVVIPIHKGETADLLRVMGTEDEQSRFYTHFYSSGESIQFPNLDGSGIILPPQPHDCIVIQSGGKMWCGYEAFVDRIRILAPYLQDTLFFAGDEVDYIDEFRVSHGNLYYRRVHAGGWLPVDKFIETLGIVAMKANDDDNS